MVEMNQFDEIIRSPGLYSTSAEYAAKIETRKRKKLIKWFCLFACGVAMQAICHLF
jgi:hypothetical protein